MELTFSIQELNRITKITLKKNVILLWTLFQILLMLAVLCKQRVLHENEILQYTWNYKCYDVDHRCFTDGNEHEYLLHCSNSIAN